MDRVAFIALFVGSLINFVSAQKDASTQTSEKATMLEELKNLDAIDYIRAGAVFIAFAAPLLHGRRTWLMAVIIATAFGSFGDFFFPQQVLSHVTTTKIDVIHQYLLQIVAAVNIGHLAKIYQTWESRDPGVTTSILVTNAITALITCATCAFDYNKWQSRFAPQYLTLGLFPMVLFALGCIVYTFKGSSYGKGNLDFRGRIARHILFDVMCMFVTAFLYYGYADVPMTNVTLNGFKADGVHYHLVRLVGLTCFSTALSGFMTLGFQNESDQRSYLFGRVVMMLIMFPVLGLYQWKYSCFDIKNNIAAFVATGGIAGNIICGYCNLQWPKVKRS